MKNLDLSLFYRKSQKAGLPPGTIVYTGDQPQKPVHVTVFEYDREHIREWSPVLTDDECLSVRNGPGVKWINIDGVNDLELLERVGRCFNLHPLVLEDIAHLGQRPKLEEYDDYMFIVVKMLQLSPDDHSISIEQVSMILCKDCLVTFQENEGDVFDAVRQRLRGGKGRLRQSSADYLAYALVDAIVDYYFTIFETISETIEGLEERILKGADRDTLPDLHRFRHQLTDLRKSVWPLREMLGSLERTESKFFNKSTRVFLRDLYDHSIRIVDTVESFREVLTSLTDLNLSMISTRMNEVMKVLTIIATVFIPLSFIAGVYGMNFDYMPELHASWTYPWGFWLLIILVVSAMFIYFKKKNWL